MSQDVTKTPAIGASGGRPIVEGSGSGLLRGVHGFHAPGESPFDKQNARERAEAEEAGAEPTTAKKTLLVDAEDPESTIELEGTIGADGLARASYERGGITHEHVWNPNENEPQSPPQGEQPPDGNPQD